MRYLQVLVLGMIGLLMAGDAAPASHTKNASDVSGAAASPCNRECLNGFVDKYLAALLAHDPGKLPLAAAAKYTENGQLLDSSPKFPAGAIPWSTKSVA
jgi:hypothetical protein